jgi:exosortase C (VPDSG-CTERM-specific)
MNPVVTASATAATTASARRIPRGLWLAMGILTLGFGSILYSVIRLSFRSELHSHLLLIPVVSWFVWRFIDGQDAVSGAAGVSQSRSRGGALAAALFGVASIGVFFMLRRRALPVTEWLWTGALGYLFFLLAAALWTMGWPRLKGHKFALLFLLFAVPLPMAVTDALSILLQRGSAEVADWSLRLSGLPVLREGLVFRLPTMGLRVAEECSGVRSTLVLFITSLIAGKMFLRAPWKRAALALATIPLGLLRNALRITVLAWLSVNVDRTIIDGPLHHHGGPLFFALSLVPLFGLLWWFRRSEGGNKEGIKNRLGTDRLLID